MSEMLQYPVIYSAASGRQLYKTDSSESPGGHTLSQASERNQSLPAFVNLSSFWNPYTRWLLIPRVCGNAATRDGCLEQVPSAHVRRARIRPIR